MDHSWTQGINNVQRWSYMDPRRGSFMDSRYQSFTERIIDTIGVTHIYDYSWTKEITWVGIIHGSKWSFIEGIIHGSKVSLIQHMYRGDVDSMDHSCREGIIQWITHTEWWSFIDPRDQSYTEGIICGPKGSLIQKQDDMWIQWITHIEGIMCGSFIDTRDHS